MTDITEQAQSLKAAAEKAADNFDPNMFVQTRGILALVEALEKAQQRIVELESRTITVKQYDEFQICHYGATEDYAKGYIDCQNNFSKWLTAAGIKVEAE